MPSNHPFPHLDCDFSIRKSQRAKRINLQVKHPKTVIVTVPQGVDEKEALHFAKAHEAWVAEHLQKEKAKKETPPITSASGFKTKFHAFKFVPHERSKRFVRILETETHLYFPRQLKETSREVQDLVYFALRETLRNEAQEYLPQRLDKLSRKHNFTYNKVTIRNTKGRWGSCTNKKNISLSLSLMQLPFHLIDYILLHELCHTVELNHSKRFHALLDKACGGSSKMFIQEIKKYKTI